MKEFEVKDLALGSQGRLQIEWAESRMPVLMKIRREFSKSEPFRGRRLAACLHVTKETAVLVRTLKEGGAELGICGSNPLSTQDDVAACLALEDVNVYAWRGQSKEEYYECVDKVLSHPPDMTLDDGADLVTTIHTKKQKLAEKIIGGTEETTTGVVRLRAMADSRKLKYPIISVNDAFTKHLFDNRHGTGQSTLDGILRATSVLVAGKNFVVCGYGLCGSGIALRARGMGANVIVTEIDPLRALEASMNGFSVMPMAQAAELGDFFVTATGDINVIRKEHILKMHDGAILANSGHFNVEISISDLQSLSRRTRVVRPNVEEYELREGKRLYLLAEGRLVNLAAAEGHPPEVMMMSFANQALSLEYLAKEGSKLKPKVYGVPDYIDSRVAKLTLETRGISIDKLTKEQDKYLHGWKEGTT